MMRRLLLLLLLLLLLGQVWVPLLEGAERGSVGRSAWLHHCRFVIMCQLRTSLVRPHHRRLHTLVMCCAAKHGTSLAFTASAIHAHPSAAAQELNCLTAPFHRALEQLRRDMLVQSPHRNVHRHALPTHIV